MLDFGILTKCWKATETGSKSSHTRKVTSLKGCEVNAGLKCPPPDFPPSQSSVISKELRTGSFRQTQPHNLEQPEG